MNYIDENDLKTYIDEDLIVEIRKIIDAENEITNIQQAIINRCSYVDSMLSDRYETPFLEGSKYITDSLKMNLAHLVLFDLLAFFSSVSDAELSIRKTNFNNAVSFFEGVRNGKVSLTSEVSEETGVKVDRFFFDSTRRINDFH